MATRVRPKAKELYEQDFYVWTEVQSELLRQRRFETLDLDNLIEEVEGLGDAKKSAVLSNATVVVEHLLKLQFSSATDPRAGWIDSVLEHRNRLEFDLTPRLRQILQQELARLRGRPPDRGTPTAGPRRGCRGRRAALDLPLHLRPGHRRLVAMRQDRP
jgi:hypothetical protein